MVNSLLYTSIRKLAKQYHFHIYQFPDIRHLATSRSSMAQSKKNPSQSSPPGSKWHDDPPYAVQPPEEFGTVYWRASCCCGQVKYQLNRKKPLDAKFCHCVGCQKLHGAPFQWAAIFHKSDINFLNGPRGLDFYQSGENLREHKLPYLGEGQLKRDALDIFAPSCHIFYSQRVININDRKPKWEGLNGSSRRMDS
ncbi:conserved hypothetical protein [Coccidioides posadasii str. Silveira]|uniref:CENP-V/GFA domain-containing protein n=2 Tax=Coccidioides posadasii TaxID=199306 RepID=E9CSU7_COCPS|nr:conserved hypothetical protein [Coccidioides posadasii str. Silveira]KMM67446.1 hypothetical protein CPAG_03780 [Coccidioides posadasii RMSCC 3488]